MRTIPLLPCASIDDVTAFAHHLGFRQTYSQRRPNPYVALERGALVLHYFELEGFDPQQSYGSCVVLVEDTEELFTAFASGLRAAYGALPLTGLPRITRPRRRRNTGNLSGFSVIDPGGNWIRFFREGPAEEPATESRMAAALADAVVTADSRGETAQAVKTLTGALRRLGTDADPVERLEAQAFLVELLIRNADPVTARRQLDDLLTRAAELTDDQAKAAAVSLAQATELGRTLV